MLRLLERQRALLSSGKLLVVDPPADYVRWFTQLDGASGVCLNWSAAQEVEGTGAWGFGGLPSTPLADHAIVFQPKARDRLELLLQIAADGTGAKAPVFLIGENRAGIKSEMRRLPLYLDGVKKVDAAAHAVIYSGQSRQVEAAPNALEAFRSKSRYEIAGLNIDVASYPGVFGHNGLDAGTRLLLENTAPNEGKILDYGCGSGVIAAWMLASNTDSEVDCLDCDALAVAATHATLVANGVENRARVFAGDRLDHRTAKYDLIISNPPFHTGIRRDLTIVQRLLEVAPGHLRRGGKIQLVANVHLPYPKLLDKGYEWRVLTDNHKYRIYEASPK